MLDKKKFEQIKDSTVDNSYIRLKTQYVDGIQWSRPGILTGTGMSIIDKENPNKSYTGVVLNLTEDVTSTMINMINGESEKVLDTDNEKTNDFLKTLNLNSLYNNLTKEVLKTGYGYLYLHKGIEDEYSFTVLGKSNVCVEKDINDKIIRAFVVEKRKISQFNSEYIIKEYTNEYKRVYVNQELKEEVVGNMIIPIFEFGDGNEYLSSSVLHYQDVINIKLTKAFDVEKYNTDPITIIKGLRMDNSKKKSVDLGAGGVILLDKDGDMNKVNGLSLTQEFIDLLKEAKIDFYKLAKLGALKNEDLSGVTSGFALKLKLTDTLGFVENFRTTFKYNLYIMFNELYKYFGNEQFNVKEINLAPLIGDSLIEEERESKRVDTIKKTSEIMKNLVVAGYTKEEVTQYLKDNEL